MIPAVPSSPGAVEGSTSDGVDTGEAGEATFADVISRHLSEPATPSSSASRSPSAPASPPTAPVMTDPLDLPEGSGTSDAPGTDPVLGEEWSASRTSDDGEATEAATGLVLTGTERTPTGETSGEAPESSAAARARPAVGGSVETVLARSVVAAGPASGSSSSQPVPNPGEVPRSVEGGSRVPGTDAIEPPAEGDVPETAIDGADVAAPFTELVSSGSITRPALTRAVETVQRAVAQLEHAPPPRSIVLRFADLDGLQIRVTLHPIDGVQLSLANAVADDGVVALIAEVEELVRAQRGQRLQTPGGRADEDAGTESDDHRGRYHPNPDSEEST